MKTLWKITAGASLWFGLLFIVGLLGGGCQTVKDDFSFSPLPDDVFHETRDGGLVDSAYATHRFVPGEVIVLHFPGVVPELVPHEERIKDDGTITLPLIGAVEAAGKTPGELQEVIHDLYVPSYYKDLIPGTKQRRVYYVGGQVRQPGRQEYLGATTVTKAIQSAGDFTDFAARSHVELTRTDGKKFMVNCVKAATNPSLDLPVYPGDKIFVPIFVPARGWRDLFRR